MFYEEDNDLMCIWLIWDWSVISDLVVIFIFWVEIYDFGRKC